MELYQELKTTPSFFLIAGPCVVEEFSVLEEIARVLEQVRQACGIPVVFKASYKKANRSSGDSYSGPGQSSGLAALAEIKRRFGFPLLTDVHECVEVQAAAEVCEILQIPAFLSRQTDLIGAAAATGRIVNIKKGQFMAPEDMGAAALKTGSNPQVLLTERGSSFGYHNLVVDFRSFAIMAGFGYPVVFDVTHSLQLPSAGKSSGGTPEYAAMLARAAIATGKVRGLFIETHPEPAKARSDASSMLPLEQLMPLVRGCLQVYQAIQKDK